jgi:uncharacterized phiE125 gp8 family phage protein
MTWEVTSGPISEPITTQEAKDWLKVDTDVEDAIIAGLIKSARIYAEKYTGRALFAQTVKQYYDYWPAKGCIELSLPPVQSVEEITYIDSNGDTQTLDAADYTVDLVSRPARVCINPDKSWPVLGDYPNAVTVEYEAGAATTAEIPDTIKTGMLLLIAFLYENREDIPISQSNDPKIRSANWLLWPEKILH